MEVAKEIIPKYNSIWTATNNEALKKIKEDAVQVNSVKDKSEFIKAVEPVYDQFFEIYPNVSKSLFKQIKNDN